MTSATNAMMLGTWPLSGAFNNHGREMGWGEVSEKSAVETIVRAYEHGVRNFDTADVYGLGRTNKLLKRALNSARRDSYRIFLKIGYAGVDDGRPFKKHAFRKIFFESLTQLGVGHVDNLSLHHSYFGPNKEDLPELVEEIERLRNEQLIGSVGIRPWHSYTAMEPVTVLTGPELETLYTLTKPETLHIKLNILSSRTYISWLDQLPAELILVINKPFAQGRLWWLFQRDEVIFPKTDHRHYKEEFLAQQITLLKKRIASVSEDFSRNKLLLPICSLVFLSTLPRRKLITFGAKSPGQVDDFITVWDRAHQEPIDEIKALVSNLRRELESNEPPDD